MKRIYVLLGVMSLFSITPMRGEDAATEERINQLSGKIEDLIASQEAQKKVISELRKEIESLREQQNKPSTTSYASHDDLKRLSDNVKEVDRKRLEDYDKIHGEIVKLGRDLSATSPKSPRTPPKDPDSGKRDDSTKPEKGYEYIVKSGDNLGTIIKMYKEQNIKITPEQIKKANPGLQPDKLKVGQKIFIPAQ